MTQPETTVAEIAARYRAIVPPGITVKVIPRGVSGLPDPCAPGEHWRIQAKRKTTAQFEAWRLGQRLAKADARDEPKQPIAAKPPRGPNPQIVAAQERKARLMAMIADGASRDEVMRAFGLKTAALTAWIRIHGVTVPAWSRKAKADRTTAALANAAAAKAEGDAMRAKIRDMHEAGSSTTEIAVAVNRARNTVCRALRDMGIRLAQPRPVVAVAVKEKTAKPEPKKRVRKSRAKPKDEAAIARARATAEECARLFKGGMTDAQIAARLGISRSSAQRRRQSVGIYGETPQTTETHRAILAQREAGFSVRSISKALGVSKSTVSRIANRIDQQEAAQ
jgi:DNA-binding CsgD family transcriptional regulator